MKLGISSAVCLHPEAGMADDECIRQLGFSYEDYQRQLSLECACKRFPAPMRQGMGDLAVKSLPLLDPDNFG